MGLSNEDLARFREYTKNPMLKNESFDCYEIAEDLKAVIPNAQEVIIKEQSKRFFKVLEFGKEEQYIEHYVLVKNGYVLDPRYNKEPVKWNDYFNKIKSLNKNLIIEHY